MVYGVILRHNNNNNNNNNNNSNNRGAVIATGYGLDDRGSILGRGKSGSGALPASHPMGTRSSFPGAKASGA
jgi:hypothetical protein